MSSYLNQGAVLFSIIMLFFSCDRPQCKNNNAVFNDHVAASSEYKIELAKQINEIGPENLRYWLKAYVEEYEQEYLLVYVQNDSLCAVMQLKVNDWDEKIKHIREKKGVGRRGAELRGLKYVMVGNENSASFVYDGLARIID
ncbi:MAG: hypothetical protein KJP09_10080 [Bacteroidia bacterium]|nr:hypothetical protein [Bacteroidia bacterium]NNK27088.1 hypothetical protein [Flavobacteriaceae bacterium]